MLVVEYFGVRDAAVGIDGGAHVGLIDLAMTHTQSSSRRQRSISVTRRGLLSDVNNPLTPHPGRYT